MDKNKKKMPVSLAQQNCFELEAGDGLLPLRPPFRGYIIDNITISLSLPGGEGMPEGRGWGSSPIPGPWLAGDQ